MKKTNREFPILKIIEDQIREAVYAVQCGYPSETQFECCLLALEDLMKDNEDWHYIIEEAVNRTLDY